MGNDKAIVSFTCPACHGEMNIRELECKACDLQVRGHFGHGRFDRLSPEQYAFLEVFLKRRGVLRDVEMELGISYPTVRARLDGLLAALGFAEGDSTPVAAKPSAKTRRKDILSALDAGQIDPKAALEALQEIKP